MKKENERSQQFNTHQTRREPESRTVSLHDQIAFAANSILQVGGQKDSNNQQHTFQARKFSDEGKMKNLRIDLRLKPSDNQKPSNGNQLEVFMKAYRASVKTGYEITVRSPHLGEIDLIRISAITCQYGDKGIIVAADALKEFDPKSGKVIIEHVSYSSLDKGMKLQTSTSSLCLPQSEANTRPSSTNSRVNNVGTVSLTAVMLDQLPGCVDVELTVQGIIIPILDGNFDKLRLVPKVLTDIELKFLIQQMEERRRLSI